MQVVISEAEHGAERLSLWDDDGAFLEVDPEIEHVGACGSDDRGETEPDITCNTHSWKWQYNDRIHGETFILSSPSSKVVHGSSVLEQQR